MSRLEDEKKAEERAKAVQNERVKLSATYLNATAVAAFAVGGLTVPLNSVSQGHPFAETAPLATASFLASFVLHYLARALLRGLR